MLLQLSKPLAFFDLETTGITVGNDRIVEICILKLMPDGSKQVYTKRINPEIPIPEFASKVHGIYNEDVENEATFKQLAPEIAAFIGNADLAGYNSNKFDIPVLAEELLRADVSFDVADRHFVDVQNILQDRFQEIYGYNTMGRTIQFGFRLY